jgi:hyperosmotically inducible protein
MRKLALSILVLACSISLAFGFQARKRDLGAVHARLTREVRHQLMLLPYYSVFDNLEFKITGVDTVTLTGQVTRPTLKSDAESAVRSLEGVGKVVNQIEVLPLSSNDDRIRMAAYRAIFSKPGLDRYGVLAVPSIHIIVKNGNITLVGVVNNEADKDLAGIAAREVPGVFDVVNNLRIEKADQPRK